MMTMMMKVMMNRSNILSCHTIVRRGIEGDDERKQNLSHQRERMYLIPVWGSERVRKSNAKTFFCMNQHLTRSEQTGAVSKSCQKENCIQLQIIGP